MEKSYVLSLKHSQVRELQRALLYHKAIIMDPTLEKYREVQDYTPTMDYEKRVAIIESVIEYLNSQAGIFKEDFTV